MNNRLLWPDNAKALAIFLVFLGHLLEGNNAISPELVAENRYIYAFHIPLFFMVAGYFFREKRGSFGELVVSKFKSRMVPVLFFTLVAYPLWLHPDWWNITNVDPESVHYHLWRLLRGFPNLNWPCWFLFCLMLVELIAAELIPMLRGKWKLGLAIPIIYIMGRLLTDKFPAEGVLVLEKPEDIWFLQEAFVALPFYLAGHLLAQTGWLAEVSVNRRLMILPLLLVIFIAATHFNFPDNPNMKVNMSTAEHGGWIYFPVAGLTGALGFLLLCQFLPQNRLLTYVGSNTLPLMGINGLFLHFFNRLIAPACDALGHGYVLLAVYIAASLVSLLLCLPLVWLFNRCVPWCVGQWR